MYKNPVILVEHPARELRQKPAGGSERKHFVDDVSAHRKEISQQWGKSANEALARAERGGLNRAVLKVKLHKGALAKSHRPHYLLEQAGRGKVIGGTKIGTLLVSVSRHSAAATANSITENITKNGVADVTTIEKIEAYTSDDVATIPLSDPSYRNGALARLFRFGDQNADAEAREAVRQWAERKKAELKEVSPGTFSVKPKRANDLEGLVELGAIRELVPNHVILEPQHAANVDSARFQIPAPVEGQHYSLVGLLDSGCYPVKALKPWLASQSNPIALEDTPPSSDFTHGTFIGGLLASARQLNGAQSELPLEPVRIVDVRVFSKAEQTKGDDLIARIGDALREHPQVKVWNLSIGVPSPHQSPEFSWLARELDVLASQRNVLFVVSAGNDIEPTPLRPWPAGDHGIAGRDIICSPADTVLGLTVGSIAHSTEQGGVKRGEPAPYSRRGPGPAAIPKPEVVHFGGNCTLGNQIQGGLTSLATNGMTMEWHGTSFAAPMVASVAAQLWDTLETANRSPTPALVKGMVVHSAAVHSPQRPADELHYFGFGQPIGLPESLLCTDEMFTTIHTVYIPQGQEVHHKFPMPQCLLVNGKFRGEVIITVCYPPILNPDGGAEYCRSNVNVSMGPVLMGKDQKLHFKGSVPADPKKPSDALEESLIAHGMKWSPLKVYRRRFQGIEGTDWELRFDVLYRAGEPVPPEPQQAHAIVTVRGIDEGLHVYRDGVRALRNLRHRNSPFVTSAHVRVR
nr:S8 family peptidase [Stenotrophomonas acidaminiphila]